MNLVKKSSNNWPHFLAFAFCQVFAANIGKLVVLHYIVPHTLLIENFEHRMTFSFSFCIDVAQSEIK